MNNPRKILSIKDIELLESKNIDIKVENKFEALKQYANKYNVNWGFVRDYDKNESLYLCNTEYTEDMENENWKLLKNSF